MIKKTLAMAILLTALLAGCGSQPATGPAGGGTPTAPSAPTGELTVLAAASLTESFDVIGKDFEAAYPGSSVTFSYGSSATLATQITQGAPADVFAAANESTMKTVTDASAASTPRTFATNTLEIAVPPGNPAKITGLADFADENKKIAICAPQVPCGSAAEQVFAAAGITAKPDTLEQDVKATLQKVELDEVDAALVYKTDVASAGEKVEGIEFPEASKAVNVYPIASLTQSKNADLAQAFVDYVLSDAGQQTLEKVGFGKPQ